jgi:hypothetical protein
MPDNSFVSAWRRLSLSLPDGEPALAQIQVLLTTA